MAAGKVHDHITRIVAGCSFVAVGLATRNLNVATWIMLGCWLGGYFLSPDLDIRSRPFQRWGPLRSLWLPYQKSIAHRSAWSHAPIIGTTLRLLYLGVMVGGLVLVGMGCGAIGFWLVGAGDRYASLETLLITQLQALFRFVWTDGGSHFWAGVIGVELGSIAHILTDHWDSWRKRQAKQRQKRRPPKGTSSHQSTQTPSPQGSKRQRSTPTRRSTQTRPARKS
ncbi:MAG: hypothetical protein EA001_03130 [Oscillatoriales cyanobacterium]|nr:MAG: hypothetical protein EA001_03130 [Oscillatoriales cyanobacterium]